MASSNQLGDVSGTQLLGSVIYIQLLIEAQFWVELWEIFLKGNLNKKRQILVISTQQKQKWIVDLKMCILIIFNLFKSKNCSIFDDDYYHQIVRLNSLRPNSYKFQKPSTFKQSIFGALPIVRRLAILQPSLKTIQKVMYGYYISLQTEMDKQNAQFSETQEMGSPNPESITLSTLQGQNYLQKCQVYQETQSNANNSWKNVARQWTITVLMVFLCLVIIAVYILNSNVGYPEDKAGGEKNSLAYNENNTKKVKRLKNVQKRLERKQPEYKQIEHFGISTLKKLNTPLSKYKKQPYQVKHEDLQYEYDVSGSFSLWDINSTYKKTLFQKYKALPQSKIVLQDKDYIDINYGKDEQFTQFAKDHQNTIQVIKWNSFNLSTNDVQRISDDFEAARLKRRLMLQKLMNKYKKDYGGRQGLMNPKKNIAYKRFLQSLEYEKLTGQDFKKNFQLKKVYQREKQYYRKNYRTDKPKYEIPACIIAPTYNNVIDHRYLWHLQSILQQDYKNYKLILIDDASTDQTAHRISQYLKWRNADPQKVILIKNKKHKTAMPNLFYGIHKYCDYNQILYIVDGDDELVGTQVFQLFNSLYQQKKYYMFYSSHFQYESKNQTHPMQLGLPFAYPEEVKRKAGYRTYEHAYSQLRTIMSDLILLLRTQSLRDQFKNFYWTICDNALYFSAMELSCGRVDYIPQLEYWYNADTSVNDWRTTEQKSYRRVKEHINFEQRHYRCIHSTIRKIRAAVEGGKQN